MGVFAAVIIAQPARTKINARTLLRRQQPFAKNAEEAIGLIASSWY
jgi:hypothetical protein